MKFIDLFAGLGGFHQALRGLGHKCVFGSEINPALREVYKTNFGVDLAGDIRKVNVREIPAFDILCAGFPCQSFSKAGKQLGIQDERGALFNNILTILREHTPKYFILENVPHLARHDDKKTWLAMKTSLQEIGYKYIECREYSPHEFGIPQHRRRIYIVGSLHALNDFDWIEGERLDTVTDIKSILDTKTNGIRRLEPGQLQCIDVWQEFLEVLKADEPIGFPIWGFEFGATYPYQRVTPYSCSNLSNYKGSFGTSLRKENHLSKNLPSYARLEQERFPDWKQHYIYLNRRLYKKYEKKLARVIKKIEKLPLPSWQKFEWNCQYEPRIINDKILQFRASGLRVKKTDFVPSLVCTNTQIPIIGWETRYITLTEALRLQSFPEGFNLPKLGHTAYVALGNAVNVHIVSLIAEKLLSAKTAKGAVAG